jgi:glycosyltransferase involved in cell wall biosynthesis
VDLDRFALRSDGPEEFFLVASRLVGYKRIDLAVAAANRMGRRLIVVGDGPERDRLRAMAGRSVEFRGHVDDAVVADLLARCRALIFPGHEDFGITPVEAQAAGRPVIAYARGGAVETVRDGVTGVLFETQSVEALEDAIRRCEGGHFEAAACRANAERFDAAEFRRQFSAMIERHTGPSSRSSGGAPKRLEVQSSRAARS